MAKLKAVKGFADIFAPDSNLYTYMESVARRVFGSYGYEEFRTPILEYTELFTRSIGTETDVVQKEMFSLEDRRGRSITMRPEATAGISRAFIEHNINAQENMAKFFTYGPMFRYERPQKGRMRQFHQLNCECIGVGEPYLDAEMILMLMHFMTELGIKDLSLELNTLGCKECRPPYREKLIKFLKGLDFDAFCENCQRRMETNPLRVLDCKVEKCQSLIVDAPSITDNVCDDCRSHFDLVVEVLDRKKVPYVINPRLVRGLDYYTRTTFELISSSIGAQGSVAGGGRYDGLMDQLGGQDLSSIGFACGMERLALCLGEDFAKSTKKPVDFFIAIMSDNCLPAALDIAETLRYGGLKGEMAYASRSLRSQMRQASRMEVAYCFILGDDELATESVSIRDMESGDQTTLHMKDLPSWIAQQVEKK